MDLFARPLPTFNIGGMQKVSSCIGFIFSVILYIFVIGYAMSKLVVFFGDGNPILSIYKVHNEYGLKDKVNLDDFGF